MLTLAIESSCDDTAAAVLVDDRTVLSSVVSSQFDVHARYGGIVPELASRRHIEAVWPVVEEALTSSRGGAFADRPHCRDPGSRPDRLPAGRLHLCQGTGPGP